MQTLKEIRARLELCKKLEIPENIFRIPLPFGSWTDDWWEPTNIDPEDSDLLKFLSFAGRKNAGCMTTYLSPHPTIDFNDSPYAMHSEDDPLCLVIKTSLSISDVVRELADSDMQYISSCRTKNVDWLKYLCDTVNWSRPELNNIV